MNNRTSDRGRWNGRLCSGCDCSWLTLSKTPRGMRSSWPHPPVYGVFNKKQCRFYIMTCRFCTIPGV